MSQGETQMRSNRFRALMMRASVHGSAVAFMFFVFALLACAQRAPSPQQPQQPQPDPRANKPGHHDIKLADLPPPEVQRGPANFSKVIPRPEGAELTLPQGFEISVWAEGGLERPRWMAEAPNGDVFVAESEGNRISVLRDKDKDGKVDERSVFATGLARPFGMAFWRDYLYVGNTDAVVRFKYKSGQTAAEGAPEKVAS